jgi:hypothetical protein
MALMALTSDEIKQIEDAADALNGWRDYVTKTHSDALGCYISLRHAFETQVDKAVDILLAKKLVLGQNIKKECDKLLKEAKLVEELYEQNAADARVEEAEVLGSARRLISRLQQIAQSARNELSAKKLAGTGRDITPAKIINIENFKGVLGDVQAENVQTGDYASIHKQPVTEEKKKGIIKKTLKIIGAIVIGIISSLIAAILIDIFGDFGWIVKIKTIIYHIQMPK